MIFVVVSNNPTTHTLATGMIITFDMKSRDELTDNNQCTIYVISVVNGIVNDTKKWVAIII